MPITVYDAVGKFTADTRNLDEFVTKLDRALPDASQKSAVATKVLKDAQDNLKASLRALREEGGNTAENWQKVADAQRQVAIASGANKRAHDDLNKSIGAVKQSTHEATGEAELLGRIFGIELPREVRKFIAEIPGFANLLKAAFSVTAIYFFIQALGEGVLKIEDVIRALAGWDEAAKKTYADQLTLNKAFIDLAHQQEDLKVKEKERGLEGLALTRQQIADGKELLGLNTQRLQVLAKNRSATQNQLDAENSLGKAVEAWSKGSTYIEERKEIINQLTAATKANDQELVALLKERLTIQDDIGNKEADLRKQSLAQHIAVETAKTEATRVQADARIDLDLSVWRNEVAAGIISNQQLLALEAKANEDRYQNDLAALNRKLELKKLDPDRNVVEIQAIQGQIEAMQTAHNAVLIDNDTDYVEQKKKLDALLNDPLLIQDIAAFDAQIEAAEQAHNAKMLQITVDGLQAIAEARHRLQEQVDKGAFQAPTTGKVTLSFDDQQLVQAVDILAKLGDQTAQASQRAGEAQAAYDSLAAIIKARGGEAVDSQELLNDTFDAFKEKLESISKNPQLLLGLKAVIEQEIEATQAWGGDTAALEEKLAAVEKRLKGIGSDIDDITKKSTKGLSPVTKIFQELIKGSITAGQAAKAMAGMFVEALGSSVTAALMGSVSFGQAMESMLKSMLATLAGEAVVQAIREWAAGLAAAARYDYASAALHYASAKTWAVVAAVAAVGAAAIPGSHGGGGGGSSDVPQTEAAAGIKQGPIQQESPQKQNVPRFATSALVTAPTLAIVGDAINGSSASSLGKQDEAIIGLDDDRATSRIAQAIVKHMPPMTIQNHNHIYGKSIRNLIKEINHEVTQNDARLTSSNSFKVTRKA